MSDREEQQENNRLSTIKENALFFAGAVVVFNIILVVVWVAYIFRSYEDFTRFHNSLPEFAIFDRRMKHAVPGDIALGAMLNVMFMVFLSEWLRRFRSGKDRNQVK